MTMPTEALRRAAVDLEAAATVVEDAMGERANGIRQTLAMVRAAIAPAEAQEKRARAAVELRAALIVAHEEIHHPGACRNDRGQDIADYLDDALTKEF